MPISNVKIKKFLLIAGDIFTLYVGLYITLLARYQNEYTWELWRLHLFPFTVVILLWILIFYINELYDIEYGGGRLNVLSRLFTSLLVGSVFSIAFFYFGYNNLFTIRPQRVFIMYFLFSLLLLYLWRIIATRYLISVILKNNLLIVGLNPLMVEIIKKIKRHPQLGFAIKGIIPLNDDYFQNNIFSDIEIYNKTSIHRLKDICMDAQINTIISVANPRESDELQKNLFECLSLKINFTDASNFYEKITGKIPVKTIQHIWFLENLNESTKVFYEIIKRLLDIIFSLLGIIITLPFIPFIIMAIKLDDHGPIFFVQKRLCKNGKIFLAMKFRTMNVGAEKNGPQWATKNDPRITRIGKFLRKTRIDEIPQLINVLKGEMSFIGPRPERPEFVEKLQKDIPFYKERLLVKPGLTGWAQVMGPSYGGSFEETLEKLQYDLFYIKNRSLGLDFSILLKTIKIVLLGKGQ